MLDFGLVKRESISSSLIVQSSSEVLTVICGNSSTIPGATASIPAALITLASAPSHGADNQIHQYGVIESAFVLKTHSASLVDGCREPMAHFHRYRHALF